MSGEQARAQDPLGTILVVDDNEDNCNVLTRRLARVGYEFAVANDGPSALEACKNQNYDAVILDVMMPGMSGMEVLEQLRKTKSATELPVIMATAKTDSVDVVDALKRGANDYVTKPIDFPVLLARLEMQIGIKKEADTRSGSVIDVTLGIESGTVLDGRYEILDKQGEGGFAVVYRATQISTQQEVALKHARPDVMRADEDGVHLERFKREVTLIGQLNHPHVVRLIDSGSIPVRRAMKSSSDREMPTRVDGGGGGGGGGGEAKPGKDDGKDNSSRTRRRPSSDSDRAIEVPYIVMEFLRGESLADLIAREGPLDAARTVDLILPVISALGAAHSQGVVHRDVKPGNIMLSEGPDGAIEPKVLDFGIAKLTEPDQRALTISASLIGTPQYMAPEQARGQKDVDGRADQFAIASVAYEMLTGKSLYRGESFLELVAKVLSADYLPMTEVKPELPLEFVQVVTKALAPLREHRYESMKAFGQALLPYASVTSSLRWADAFGEIARVSLVGGAASSATIRAAQNVKIRPNDDSSGPTDATVVAVGVGNLVAKEERASSPKPVGDNTPVTIESAGSEPKLPQDDAPPPKDASAPLANANSIQKATTWVWIAVIFMIGVVVAKACL